MSQESKICYWPHASKFELTILPSGVSAIPELGVKRLCTQIGPMTGFDPKGTTFSGGRGRKLRQSPPASGSSRALHTLERFRLNCIANGECGIRPGVKEASISRKAVLWLMRSWLTRNRHIFAAAFLRIFSRFWPDSTIPKSV